MPTSFQYLTMGSQCSIEAWDPLIKLPNYVQGFESIFAKDSFDVLLEHHHWDHTIELIPRSETKSLKVYPLSPVEQSELDIF